MLTPLDVNTAEFFISSMHVRRSDVFTSKPPIPTLFLEKALGLILQENSFQFCGKNYLQTHGTAMGTKMTVAFANIFKAGAKLKQNSLAEAHSNRSFGNDISTISSPSGISAERS